MSHMLQQTSTGLTNESCHAHYYGPCPYDRVILHTREWAMSHIWMSRVTQTWMRHVTHVTADDYGAYCRELPRRALRMSYEWVMSHKLEGVMSHILLWMTTGLIAANCSMNKSWISHVTHTRMSHVTHMNESCHTNMKKLCHNFYSGWLRGLLPWIARPGSELQCDWQIGKDSQKSAL